MLEGIETGYEEKYDFPHRAGKPERMYMFASVPRSGSTFLSHLLWQSGSLGAPLEYLNFLPSGPYHFVSGAPDKQLALWRTLLHRRTSPNGVFGIKCFPTQLRELGQSNPRLFMEVLPALVPTDGSAKIVRLKRRDKLAHAISYARAALSGVWRKEQEAGEAPRVEYSKGAVEHARSLLEHQEQDWDRLFAEARAEPLTLWYEDVMEQPEDTVRKVAAFLDVDVDPAARIAIPTVERQAQQDPRLWAERYSGSPSS